MLEVCNLNQNEVSPSFNSNPISQAVELLSQGAEPNTRDKKGLTPAHYAAAHGHLDVAQYLATKGVDLDVEDERARTPLHYAALSGNPEVRRDGCTIISL